MSPYPAAMPSPAPDISSVFDGLGEFTLSSDELAKSETPGSSQRSSTSSDEVDSVLVRLISPPDSSAPSGGVKVQIGEIATIGPVRILLALRGSPARFELREVNSSVAVSLTLDPEIEVEVGGAKLRIIGADSISLARIISRGTKDQRSTVIFWNGVTASQLTLASRMLRKLQASDSKSAGHKALLARAKEKLLLLEWLKSSSETSPKWKSELGDSVFRMSTFLQRHGSLPSR